MNKEEAVKLFWNVYDQYLQTEDRNLRPELSRLLKKIEKGDKASQLLRPEKGWNQILAWQVLREQSFFYNSSLSFLFEGEVVAVAPNRDKDILLTRIPTAEIKTGLILRPGFKLDYTDRKEKVDFEWEQKVAKFGITDERGLYLPLYEIATVERFCLSLIEEAKKNVLDYLKEQKRG